MSLAQIKTVEVNAYFTKEAIVDMYIYDTIKQFNNNTLDSVFNVTNAKEFNTLLGLVNVAPYLAEKWLFILDYSKVSGLLKKYEGILLSETSNFIIKLQDYKAYLEFNKNIVGSHINSMYLTTLQKEDLYYLLAGKGLSDDLLQYVRSTYYNDISKIFEIREYLLNGGILKSRKDILEVFGVSVSSLQSLSLTLLRDLPQTEKGKKKSLSKVLTSSLLLTKEYGYRKAYYFLLDCIKSFLDLKMLVINGIVYNEVIDVPNGYNENLKKYSRYLKHLSKISYNKIVGVYMLLNSKGVWNRDEDVVSFIYSLYTREGSFDVYD